MRILLAHNYYQRRGGEDVAFENEVGLLEQHGHAVIRHTVENARIESLADKSRTFAGTIWNVPAAHEIGALIDRERPDVMHVHNFFPLLSPSVHAAARKRGVPVVQTLHNYRLGCAGGLLSRNGATCESCVGRLPLSAVLHRCYRGSLSGSLAVAGMITAHRMRGTWSRHVDRLIALTEFQRGKLIEMGAPASRLIVKPNFVPDQAIAPAADKKGVLFIGRLAEGKGALELVRAWTPADRPLDIAGTGPLESEIRRIAPPNVTIHGHLEPSVLVELRSRAHVLVMPSTSFEAMPLTLLEAWAASLPVIAFRHSAFAEIIQDGVDGVLVPPGDFGALIERTRSALADPVALAAMGRAVRCGYETRFTAAVNYEMLMDIYWGAVERSTHLASQRNAARVRTVD